MVTYATTELLDSKGLVDESALVPVQTLPGRQLAAPDAARWLAGFPTNSTAKDDPEGWYQRALASDGAAAGVNLIQLARGNLSPEERQETRAFTRHTLDRGLGRVRPFALPADSYSWTEPSWSVLVKAGRQVVAHTGIIYRVIQVDQLRVPVAGIAGVMTLPNWREMGYARAMLASATQFAGIQLWTPFALVICPAQDTLFYEHLGWRVAEAPIWCEQPGGRVKLEGELALYRVCQGDAEWPSGPIDLGGAPW